MASPWLIWLRGLPSHPPPPPFPLPGLELRRFADGRGLIGGRGPMSDGRPVASMRAPHCPEAARMAHKGVRKE